MESGISLEEMETVINFRRTERSASIWTSDTVMMTKLDKLVAKSDHYTLKDVGRLHGNGDGNGRIVSKTYEVDDKSLVSFLFHYQHGKNLTFSKGHR